MSCRFIWKIAPLEQMVVCVSEGAVNKDELLAYFKALDEAGASRYRKMLDASRAECRLTAGEIAEIAAYAKSLKGQGAPTHGHLHRLVGQRRLHQAVTPMLRRTSSTIHEARRWLDRAPLSRSS